MRSQVRMFDVTSHGGVIVTGSPDTLVNSIPEARFTDIHVCPIHGVNIIVTGSADTITNTLLNARLFDVCACGAVIVTGSPDTTTN